MIRDLQAAGVVVLYEIDDYVQSARKIKSHELTDIFDAEFVREMELPMRVTDGIVCSTDYLARRYRNFNARTWACYNGIDLKRYAWPKPARTGVTIGWAGGVGHKASIERWEPAISEVMRKRPETRFMSVGFGAAAYFLEEFGPERAVGLPSGKIEVYPASMTLFDIAIAPVVGEQPLQGQERPALARGERAGHPARRAPRDVSRDRARRHGPARAHAERGRAGAARPRRRQGAARAHRGPGLRLRLRAPPRRGRRRALARRAARSGAREGVEKFLQVDQRLPITTVSQGRRQQEPYRASPPPPLSQSEVHMGCWRATHTYPTEGRIATGGLLRGRPSALMPQVPVDGCRSSP